MRVLFIGGTGIISSACTELAVRRGHEVFLLNRGQRGVGVSGVTELRGDYRTDDLATVIGGQTFDAVVNFIAYTPGDVERDISALRGKTAHYVFISSASVYQKPQTHYLMTESTPLANPYWEYSRNKIAAEERLMRAHRETSFPVTIVRPSLTYGDTLIPLAINARDKSYTIVDRIRRGKKVIIPGDGTSLWTITHNSDFAKGLVGLLGHPQTPGHAFHITSDEVITWNQAYASVAAAVGTELNPIHIASDFLTTVWPEKLGSLTGDKSVSVVFDNSKLKRFVPDFVATTRFDTGIRQSIAWFQADPTRMQIDDVANRQWDKLISLYEAALHETAKSMAEPA